MFLLENIKDTELIILCPICRFDYVHHKAQAVVVDGKDSYKASKNVRGDVILIPMYCENDHEFSLNIGQHKGRLSVWCSKIKSK